MMRPFALSIQQPWYVHPAGIPVGVDGADDEAADAVLTDDETTMLLLLLTDDASALLIVEDSTLMLLLDSHGTSAVLLMEDTVEDTTDGDDSGAAVELGLYSELELGASTILAPQTPSLVVGAPSDDFM
jgi:hypothetical protein